MLSPLRAKEYNKEYYLRNKERLLKVNAEYQKNPLNAEKRRKRIKQRYKENHLGFRDKSLRSHDKCKLNPEWRKRKNILISIWGIQNRTPEINKQRWDKNYLKNKEKYKAKRRKDKSHIISRALRRVENKTDISISEQLKDIKILQDEIKRINHI